ncbi:MAG TPA: carboxypeptidase regulatory-like domain-containing protein [Kofleriaceae bacterium]|nr:carboxypeptidase regulatory-like domain-containing protein [Kofleriaceae bacterium]
MTANRARRWWWWIAVAVVVGLAAWWLARGGREPAPAAAVPDRAAAPAARAAAPAARPAPRPALDDDSGTIDGRVLDGASHDGIAGAELTFVGEAGVSMFRTSSDGTFELTPTVTGSFALAAVTALGYLPYAPEPGRPGLRVTLARGRPVRGVELVLYPAVDHAGRVIDARGAPVAGARVRVVRSPLEAAIGAIGATIDAPATEWISGRDGGFTFQAAEDAVLEASRGSLRGWAGLGRRPSRRGLLVIQLDPAALDATITGHVRDPSGAPIADAVVRAAPSFRVGIPGDAFTISGPDGAFTVTRLDRAAYDVSAEAPGRLRAVREGVVGGSRGVVVTLAAGRTLAGQVVDTAGAPVGAFDLLIRRRLGIARVTADTESLVDPQGRFAVQVADGDYDVVASARGFAHTLVRAAAGATDLRIVLGRGATLRGQVRAADDLAPIAGASVACEFQAGGLRGDGALPAEPGVTTRADGTFELTGIPGGPLAIRVSAGGFHVRIEAAMTARDGAVLGPIAVELTRVDSDDDRWTEMVGIGANVLADGDALRVFRVVPFGGGFDAGLDFGDRIIAIDGAPVAPMGIDGALARLRGALGSTVRLTVRRPGGDVDLVVERRLIRT